MQHLAGLQDLLEATQIIANLGDTALPQTLRILLTGYSDLDAAVEALVQAVLEAEMSQAIGAEKGERTAGRLASARAITAAR